MIRDFQEWSIDLVEHSALDELRGCTVAIEAADYLNTRILSDPQWREPLLRATGGLPFAMKRLLKDDLQKFRERTITPYFVFPGLEVGTKNRDQVFRTSEEVAYINNKAWAMYDQHEGENAVAMFGRSVFVKPVDRLRYFQSILREEHVRFKIAPYSACAQLAYLSWHMSDTVHAIAGSSEILLYDVEKVITGFNFEQGNFSFIRRHKCIQDLGNITPDMFVDACLLSGTSILPTLPQLEGNSNRKPKIRGAVDLMMIMGRSGISVCMNYQDDPQFQKISYLDNFRKSRLSVKHHVILTKEGNIEPLDLDNAPGDMHEFTGQRLPDELYFYLSKGIISPKLLSWRTSGEIVEYPPPDNGDSEYYRRLVKDQLTPIRASALSVLSYSLSRFYQHHNLNARFWFDKENKELNVTELADPRPLLATWQVKSDLINEQPAKFRGAGIISFAVRSLTDTSFASKTISAKGSKDKVLLTSKDEILHNAIWRLLNIREYVDEKHQLTRWGKVLATILEKFKGKPELDEAAVIAVELARLDLLNAKRMFPTYNGGPARGTDKDKDFVQLISRVACLGRLRHKSLGYTGPLSRTMLGYNSVISAVRSSLRDLAEVSLTSLLLNGDAERDRDDFVDLGLDLPFLLESDCAMGVAVKSYLEELLLHEQPTTDETKLLVKNLAKNFWFPQCENFIGDLRSAFVIWDAVYAGMKASGDLFKDRAMWEEVNRWLEERR